MDTATEHTGDTDGIGYEAVAVGASAGGFHALPVALAGLPEDFTAAVIVVQHMPIGAGQAFYRDHLQQQIQLPVREAVERETVKPGIVFIAPPGYHLLIERDRTFALSTDRPVNYSRPSIDVLFDSTASVYRDRLVGVILTGASADGANGLQRIRANGGLTIVQAPDTAESSTMPAAAIAAGQIDHVVPLEDLSALLATCVYKRRRRFSSAAGGKGVTHEHR